MSISTDEAKRARAKAKRAAAKAARKKRVADAKARRERIKEIQDMTLLHEASVALRELAAKEGRPLPRLSMPPPPEVRQ